MRHFTWVLIATLLQAGPALAQSQTALVIPSVPAPRDPLPRFTIAPRGGALAPIGLPLPQIGLQRTPDAPNAPNAPYAPYAPHAPHAPNAPHAPYAPHAPNFGAPFFSWPMTVFYVPQPVVAPPPPPAPEPRPVAPPLPGRLILDIAPQTAQIFAGGYYVGTSEDFSLERGGGVMDAGVYRLDVNAAGYEPIAVDLRVTSGQSVTYRTTMKAISTPPPVGPTTFYLIPGCYMGNIPPKDAHLPDTCDPGRAVTWRP